MATTPSPPGEAAVLPVPLAVQKPLHDALVTYTAAVGELAQAGAAAAATQAGLSGPDGAAAFMGAADHARMMLQAHPGLLTAEGRLASAKGAAPMFTVAQRLMDDARTASKFEGTTLPPSLPATVDSAPPLASASQSTRAALRAAEEGAEAAKLAAGGAPVAAPSSADAIVVEAEEEEQAAEAGGAATPLLPDTPENRAAVIAKLQRLQQEWVAAKWAPGQPMPPGMAHPVDIFRGEMHLLPPALAQALQSLEQ